MPKNCEWRNWILHMQLQSRSAIWCRSKYLIDLGPKEKYPITIISPSQGEISNYSYHMWSELQAGFMSNHPVSGGMKTRLISEVGRVHHSLRESVPLLHRQENIWFRDGITNWAALLVISWPMKQQPLPQLEGRECVTWRENQSCLLVIFPLAFLKSTK